MTNAHALEYNTPINMYTGTIKELVRLQSVIRVLYFLTSIFRSQTMIHIVHRLLSVFLKISRQCERRKETIMCVCTKFNLNFSSCPSLIQYIGALWFGATRYKALWFGATPPTFWEHILKKCAHELNQPAFGEALGLRFDRVLL